MNHNAYDWEDIESTLKEMEEFQSQKLLNLGRKVVPTLTPEDVLQPNDYPGLESNPLFRYEEGILAGIRTVQTALFALKRQSEGRK